MSFTFKVTGKTAKVADLITEKYYLILSKVDSYLIREGVEICLLPPFNDIPEYIETCLEQGCGNMTFMFLSLGK